MSSVDSLSEELKQEFRNARSNDTLTRMLAFYRLEKAGFAKSYAVGQRFLHCSLTDEGSAIRDEIEARRQANG